MHLQTDNLAKKTTHLKDVWLLAICTLLMFSSPAMAQVTGDLEKSFRSPPPSARPWVFWWWMNGNASKQGITRDFEEMKRQGIGGALLYDAGEVGSEIPRGPTFMGDAWRELFKYALQEAKRCGIVLTVNLCSGWNCGGPWVTQEDACKKLVSAQAIVKGPGLVSLTLPTPPLIQGYYRDIAVLACPAADSDCSIARLSASSSQADFPPELAREGGDPKRMRWVSKGTKPGMGPTAEKPEFLQFDFDEPHSAAGIWLVPYRDCGPKDVEIHGSDDGQTFRVLKRETLPPRGEKRIAFPETIAKSFRVVFLSAYPIENNKNVQIQRIALLNKEQMNVTKVVAPWNRTAGVDLTKFVDASGQLKWDAPAGKWKILRLGYTLLGRNTTIVGSGPTGPEIDPMSAEAMDRHFAETGAKLIADAGPEAGKTLQYFHLDSWEIGQPDWTPNLCAEFQRRRGYNPVSWLPALAGREVDDATQTQRFMQDFQRTVADLVAENYYGRMAELTVKGGLLGTHSESGGPGNHWIDALQCLGKNAVPMGEFWNRITQPDGPVILYGNHNNTIKQAAAAAHLYGRPVCQAEAFTSLADDFTEDPWSMKDIGDAALCDGLTRMVFHNWQTHLQPDVKPGYWWPHIGIHLGYNLTWWSMADGWLTYLARCQHLLQQGFFVADFAYLQSEAMPSYSARRSDQKPSRPPGFDYDPLNTEVLLTRAAAKDGRLTLPDGMSYRYLVLPQQPDAILSPATLKKVDELAAAGVTVIRNGSLEAVTRADGLAPDIEFRNSTKDANFDWIHRRAGEIEIYFVSNQTARDAATTLVFRVAGKQPELWDAVTGEIRELSEWREEPGRTIVPLQFAPRQSWFIIFQKPGIPKSAQNFPRMTKVNEIAGPWDICFDPKWGGPERITVEKLADWSTHAEEGIRFYSGVATYRKTFTSALIAEGRRQFLDVGVVKNVARVRLNGRDLGVVWTAPWRVEMTGALKSGANELEIEVANLWPNRLIGDGLRPAKERFTTTNVATYQPTLSHDWPNPSQWARKYCPLCTERLKTGKPPELLPSGLLGPVQILESD